MADRRGFCGGLDGPFRRVEGVFTVLLCQACLAARARGRGPYPDLTERSGWPAGSPWRRCTGRWGLPG
jgi:hypothetical protein